MKQSLRLAGLLLLMSWLAACVYRPTPTPAPAVPDNSLITQSPCAPPCWQGLTPGESTWSEATDFMMNSPLINGNVGERHGPASGINVSQFWWWAGEVQGSGRGNVIDSDKSGLILYISIKPNTAITIGEVLQVYGPPTYVNLGLQYRPPDGFTTGPEGIFMDALYVEHGFWVRWFQDTPLTNRPFHFCPTTDIVLNTIEYYSPKMLDAKWNHEIDYVPPEGALKFEGKDFVTEQDGKIGLKCVTFK